MDLFNIREMEVRDIDAVMSIENQCFVSPWGKEDILRELNDNQFANLLVATINDFVVGYIDYWVTFDSATICQIAVVPGYRRQSIGTKLLKEMFKDCFVKKAKTITLEVRNSNSNAISFYEMHGFKTYLEKVNYYTNGENALYMMKEVDING